MFFQICNLFRLIYLHNFVVNIFVLFSNVCGLCATHRLQQGNRDSRIINTKAAERLRKTEASVQGTYFTFANKIYFYIYFQLLKVNSNLILNLLNVESYCILVFIEGTKSKTNVETESVSIVRNDNKRFKYFY